MEEKKRIFEHFDFVHFYFSQCMSLVSPAYILKFQSRPYVLSIN